MLKATAGICAAIGIVLIAPAFAELPRDFRPDEQATRMPSGQAVLGSAKWSVEGSDLVVGPADTSGVLSLWDKGLQDVAVYSRIKGAKSRSAGILIRVRKTAEGGISGYLVSVGQAKAQMSALVLDSAGREISRKPLRSAPPFARFVGPSGDGGLTKPATIPGIDSPPGQYVPLPPVQIIPVGGSPETAVDPASLPQPPRLPKLAPPTSSDREWDELTFLADVNIIYASLNDIPKISGVTDDLGQSYGAVALYVGPGNDPIRFSDVAYKDVALDRIPAEEVSKRFTVRKLDDFYYGWSAAVADINKDGHPDVVSGPFYYMGPDFSSRREIYVGSTYSPGTQFAPNMITFAEDATGDGWPDIFATESRQIVLYVNPGNEPHRWARHVIAPGIVSETVILADIDGDKRSELIFVHRGQVAFAKPLKQDPTKPWPVFILSEGVRPSMHGLGVGDVNGDGRPDIIQPGGWWEQPGGGATAAKWAFHAQDFGGPGEQSEDGGGNMAVADFNGDGLADIATSLNAHGFGLAWFEQKRSPTGEISFIRHMIMGDYRQKNPGGLTVASLHSGVRIADVDRDGVPDLITGKRFWAHLDTHIDPDSDGPAYLLLYRGVRDRKAEGGVRFVPEVIHNRSGVGSDFTLADVDGDGATDIVTGSTRGTFLFFGKKGRR